MECLQTLDLGDDLGLLIDVIHMADRGPQWEVLKYYHRILPCGILDA